MCKQFVIKTLLTLTIGVLMSCNVNKDTKHQTTSDSYVDTYFDNFDIPNPSVAYMVIKNGEIVLQNTKGYADVENEIRATSKTNYRIASISKIFTAIAIMKLVSDKKLTYQTTISEVFPEFPIYGDSITIEHLLLHRSGILEYYQFFEEGEQMTDEKVLEHLMSINSINSQPNEKFDYRNSGYALLAQVVEKITGKDFEVYMNDEVFIPSGMKNTSLYVKGKPINNRAYGYTVANDTVMRTDQSEGTAVKGDGCIYSSLEDFYHWDQALYKNNVISQEALQEALFGYDENGKTDKEGYGYGWEVNYDCDL